MDWNSEDWKQNRAILLKNFKDHFHIDYCQICGSKGDILVHHKSYEHGIIYHIYDIDDLNDMPKYLEVLCGKCHLIKHRKSNNRDWKKNYELK